MIDKFDASGRVTRDEKEDLRRDVDGVAQAIPKSYYRGDRPHFRHNEKHFSRSYFIKEYVAKDLLPEAPLFDKQSGVVAFGSCFAYHIGHYLFERDYNVLTRKAQNAYVGAMGDGIVNTFAIRQQFEWAWNNWRPNVDLWRDYDSKVLGHDEVARRETQDIFEAANVFIITLGLSEIWYDEPTGEVFWRAVPTSSFDPSRHKFRLSTVQENYENLKAICELIRKHRPEAKVIFTLSPIPLAATFRRLPSMVADSESKAILRVALGQLMREEEGRGVFYMPSYEIVQRCFNSPYWSDRAHVHRHVVDFIMLVFERYFSDAGVNDADVHKAFQEARMLDLRVARQGHDSVPGPKLGEDAPVKAAAKAKSGPSGEVLLASAGRSILEDSALAKVRRLGETDGTQTAMVVFPADGPPPKEAYASLPKTVQQGISENRVALVFDASAQRAGHEQRRSEALHAFVQQIGARPDQCVYLTPNRLYEVDYGAFSHSLGRAGSERMSVLNCDYWTRRLVIRAGENGASTFAERLERFKKRPAARSRAFLSLNLTPSATGLLFLARLMEDGLWDRGHIAFGGLAGETGAAARADMARLAGFEDLAEQLDSRVSSLEAYGRVLFGVLDGAEAESRLESPLAEYDDSWFSVIAEPEMLSRPAGITEKALKPLLNFQPLIFLGNPQALEAVQQLGFRTFHGFFDESYDLMQDPRQRFDMVYAEVKRLCSLDDTALARHEQAASETLIHNARSGLEWLPKRYREKLDERLLNNIAYLSQKRR